MVPAGIRARGKVMLLDILAAAAGGRAGAMAQAALRAASALFPGDEAGVWFAGLRLSSPGAAFANASMASALDIDDGHRGAAGHAGGAVVPVAVAVAEATGATGGELLDAIALGYDVALRIAASRRVEHIEHYNSGSWAAYGAAAAAGRLLRLDAMQMTQALAIAGAEAPVMLPTGSSSRVGSMVKEGLAWAAVTGLAAARRAQAGGTGPEDLLDRESHYDHDVMTGDLGQRWEVMNTYLKPYACCRYIHAAIDAIEALRRPGRPVVALTVEVFPVGLTLPNAPAPHSLEAAQYSYPFCCALAALRGIDALRPMDPAALRDPEVLALAARVVLVASPDFAGAFPARTPARVVLDQGDGPRSMTVEHPRGDVANPMTADEIAAKLRALCAGHLPATTPDAIIAAVEDVEVAGLAPVIAALRTRSKAEPTGEKNP